MSRHILDVDEAGEFLGLPRDAVRALVDGGFLASVDVRSDGPRFAYSDLKGFAARNAADEDLLAGEDGADPQALLDALDGRSEEMARRAFEIFRATFPEAGSWSIEEQRRFVDQARKRFEAILAVTGQGEDVDRGLVVELEEVGAGAAWAGSPLPQLLVVLRISRDLVVQTAVEVAEESGRHWGLALSLLLTRVLPAIDRLTDAIARGYYFAMVHREEELRVRMESVVEHSSDGVFEVDLDGRLTYANPALASILGTSVEELDGVALDEVLAVPLPGLEALLRDPPEREDRRQEEVEAARPDGVRRSLVVTTFPRRAEEETVGFQGIVRDVTAERELERARNELLALITHDLRSPLATMLGHGVTLQVYAEDLPIARLRAVGSSIHRSAERMARLADDLHDVAQLANRTLTFNLRAVQLREVVEAALASVPDPFDRRIEVPEAVEVVADPRRLEQVVANLVENALRHGEPPVAVAAEPAAREVRLSVVDHGQGVPEAVVPTLFSSLRTVSGHGRDRGSGAGLGLFLVRGLVEGMGGRVSYEPAPTGGAAFHVWLPAAGRRG